MSNPRLRVAFDNSLTRANVAGSGMYASQLIRQLANDPGLDFQVLNGPNLGSGHGFISRVFQQAKKIYWSRLGLAEVLRQGHFDVVHAPAFVVPTDLPCPSVVTIYDLSFALFPDHFRGRWRHRVESQMPAILRSVSAVMCLSEQTKKDLLRFYKISPDKVHVVYCGVDHVRFHPQARLDSDWAKNTGLRSGYILHVGSLSARKNIPVLLKAVAQLRTKDKWGDCQLVLAGAESRGLTGAAEVYQTIKELALGEIVLLPGHVPDQQIPGLYAEATALVMPTLYEGFGLPVLEAMASGTPVVASNNSSIPEVAGDAALLVQTNDSHALADAIEKVIDNPETAARMRKAGLLQAQKFSWKRMADETTAVYRSVAG